ncbi:hypothetical protein [Crocosphaera sp.]|uniref:hypothetical protein n=1 Tax=Crocosphaera sp. TaxID=2729996 RepID=UPI003F1EED85|nr:mechanosensitive ion channel [Crocosphaera sp.]
MKIDKLLTVLWLIIFNLAPTIVQAQLPLLKKKDEIKQAKQLLTDILAADARILKDPAPTIGLLELADSSVNFAVRPWVKQADYWDVFFSLQETVKEKFDEAGINIPFPQQDIHIHQS